MAADDWSTAQRQYWDAVSNKYDDLYVSRWSIYEDQRTSTSLERFFEGRTGRVLDLACGTGLGYFLVRNISPNSTYVGVDISERMLDRFKDKFPEAEAKVFCTSMDDLHMFAKQEFDFVICLNTAFSFCDRPHVALSEFHRVLANSGRIFLSVLNGLSLRRLVRLKRARLESYVTRGADLQLGTVPAATYTRAELVRLMTSVGFAVEAIEFQSVLAGVIEKRLLIPIDRALSVAFPRLGHMLSVTAAKR